MQFIEEKAKKVAQLAYVATNTQKRNNSEAQGFNIRKRYIARPIAELEDRQI